MRLYRCRCLVCGVHCEKDVIAVGKHAAKRETVRRMKCGSLRKAKDVRVLPTQKG